MGLGRKMIPRKTKAAGLKDGSFHCYPVDFRHGVDTRDTPSSRPNSINVLYHIISESKLNNEYEI